jgi:hypothetical protein
MKILSLLTLAALLAVSARAQAPAPLADPLPVRQVTLFTSGVSYTERGGEVDGNASVALVFRTAQINDILKSLVLIDARGRVQPALYAARDPIGRTLQSFAIDVTQNLSQMEILNRLRGAKVTVETTNKGVLTGQIVGVEQRQVAGDDGKPITAPYLILLGDSGLTAIRLDAEKTVKLLDERLDREFREALGLLASGADEQRRQVTLRFAGEGRRPVRVGYVMEAPLWKMSYRLLLGGAKGGPEAKPYLQGWALVENTSDDDWKDVRLSLVSGRPVSFIQDLYQPLYLPRPVVPPDVIASPYPQTHGANLQEETRKVAEGQLKDALAQMPQLYGGTYLGTRSDRAGGEKGEPGPPGAAGFGGGGLGGGRFGRELSAAESAALLRRSVQAQAAGQSAGELFEYRIETPVTLPRQQAAMIPVVAQDIEVEKVSLYNADTDGRFPLNAVRVKNTTGLHLKGGPITLFDEGVYAGDAKMEDIPPGDSRLVSYAVDLAIEGERQGPGVTTTETGLSLKRGVLVVTRRERQETTYTLKSKADRPRVVLVEHPFNAEYKLIAPEKAAERASDRYRFAVTVPPGKSETLKVVTERPLSQSITVMDTDMNALGVYANRKEVLPKLREALQEVIQRRRKVQELQSQAAGRDAEITAISSDQERIRKNMTALDRTSALYKRYVAELDQQETRIQSLRKEAARLRGEADNAGRELRAYVDGLNIGE